MCIFYGMTIRHMTNISHMALQAGLWRMTNLTTIQFCLRQSPLHGEIGTIRHFAKCTIQVFRLQHIIYRGTL